MDEIFTEELTFDAEVTEMAADAGSVVQLDATRVSQLLAATQDENPEFPIVRVEGGLSKNGNNWSDAVLDNIAEQVNTNEPVGYLGHIKPEDDGYAFPEPQTIWLKAVSRSESGRKVLYVKGYNFPEAKIRQYLKTGVTKMTSWRGKASGKVVGGVRQVEKFLLESWDWSRKGKQGMNAEVVAIATEMEGSENEVDDLSKVTVDQLRAANPSLFTLVEQECQAKFDEQTSEMKDKAEKADEAESIFAKLRQIFKIEDDADIIVAMTKIHEQLDNLSSKTIKDKVAELLTKKITDEKARKTVLRLMPITEMEGLEDEALTKKVNELLDSDEEMQVVITEMGGAPAPLSNRRGQHDNGGSRIGQSGGVREVAAKKL